MKEFIRRIAAALFTATLIVPVGIAVTPQRAQAITFIDPINLVQNTIAAVASHGINLKEFVLDPLARAAAQTAVRSMMRSVINWANSGFEGSPAFVTDLQNNLQGLADFVADSFIDELGIRGYINSPFRDIVIRELRDGYRRATGNDIFFERNRYTLGQYSDDPAAFYRGDISRGGLRAWIQGWVNPANNPYGALGQARQELDERIARATSERRTQLEWSRGVLSWCGSSTSNPRSVGDAVDGKPTLPDADEPDGPADLGPKNTGCAPGESVRTPGTVIHERITRTLNTDIDWLVSADEIDEMLGAVLQGLVNKMFEEAGLFGFSQPSSGGGASPLDQATGAAQQPIPSSSSSVVDGQIFQLEQYREQWQRLREAAERAHTACSLFRPDSIPAEVTETLARSATELARAEALIAELRAIHAKLTATGTNRDAQMREGMQEYDEILRSQPPRLPSIADISYAAAQSQDAPDADPLPRYTALNQITARNCR